MGSGIDVRLRVPRGEEVVVRFGSSALAQEVFDWVVREEGLDASTVKIVAKKGRRVAREDALRDVDTSRLMVMGTTRAAVDEVIAARSDPSLRGFAMEEERERRRKSVAENGAAQHAEYKFCKFVVVERFVGGPNEGPHHFDAVRLLHKLASDVNFLLARYGWTVGALVEMDPRDDRLLKKKEAEGDGGCLLGYNENHGSRIYVRLRSDDGSFRDYDDLIQTLLHELCHNNVGPHNAAFFALYADLRKAYLDRSASKSEPTRVNTLASTRRGDAKGRVEDELNREAANAAISPEERMSAALVSAAVHNHQDKPHVEPVVRARRTQVDKALAAAAAERRAAPSRVPAVDVPPAPTSHATREARVVAAAARLRALAPPAAKNDAVETLITILKNAGLDDPKFKRVRTTNNRFLRTVGKFAAALELLGAVGFEREQNDGDDVLCLRRDDPALLRLGRSALEDIVAARTVGTKETVPSD
ncbi:hypothetical protein CTAYLR_000776 [Chrysophaeum taylorii]|uniref:WLM domain-containing protein n=1 Tax=Chrysophaeum taylorii TaxID=2483200 RepID=A0AAD7URQ6_9STRA|nr:hypothetical protein CTAYLR_000776 [Chrysophaeum taylorii]